MSGMINAIPTVHIVIYILPCAPALYHHVYTYLYCVYVIAGSS